MITEKTKKIICQCGKKYNVKKIYLFGSSVQDNLEPNDIDLAVEGILPQYFFKLYGDLIAAIPEKIDLVDLSEQNRFNKIILQEGLPIYESA